MPTDNKPLQLVSLFKKHKTPVSCLEFEFTSDKLLSSSRDSLLYKSDVLTGRELQCCEGHKNKITHIASMNSDACFTASAVEDERVIWWDLNLGIERRSVRLSEGDSVYDAAAYDMKVSPRTGSLLITTINQYVNQWNIVAMTLTVLSIAAFEILVAGKYHAFVGTNLINVYDLWFDFRYSLSIPGLMVQDAISV
jgi:WD40 repeat protein